MADFMAVEHKKAPKSVPRENYPGTLASQALLIPCAMGPVGHHPEVEF